MGDILAGETFVDGQTVSGTRLNDLVNKANVQPELISSQALVTPVVGDHVLIRQNSSGLLKKASVGGINGAGGVVTSVGLDMPSGEFNVSGSPVTAAGTLAAAWKAVGTRKVFAAPAGGGTGQPSFRALDATDHRLPSVVIAALLIDWDLSNSFHKSLGGVTNFTFNNAADGRTIHVAVQHNTFLAHFPGTIHWANGDEPQPNLATSIFKFTVIQGVIYGWLEAVNCRLP